MLLASMLRFMTASHSSDCEPVNPPHTGILPCHEVIQLRWITFGCSFLTLVGMPILIVWRYLQKKEDVSTAPIDKKFFIYPLLAFDWLTALFYCLSVTLPKTVTQLFPDGPKHRSSSWCQAQGGIIVFLNFGSILCTLCIMWLTYRYEYFRHHPNDPNCLMRYFSDGTRTAKFIFSFLIFLMLFFPILAAAVGFFGPPEDDTIPVWCWMRGETLGQEVFGFFASFLWLLLAWGCNLFFSFGACYLWGASLPDYSTHRTVALYLIVFLVCYAPAVVNRFIELVIDHDIWWLFLLQSILEPLTGLLNCIIYVMVRDGANPPPDPNLLGENTPLTNEI